MKHTIEALWRSAPAEIGCLSHTNPFVEALERLLSGRKQELQRVLTGDTAETFEQYLLFLTDYIGQLSSQAFVSGFSTGVRLVMESMQDE